ncbi:MAG: YdaS family helix-turn-helix protein [Candidatus Aquirickettsiella sp.]
MQEAMLDKAIYSLGSVKHMAKKLGIHREHIYAWLKGVSKIPLEYALQIEYLTGGEINWKDLVPFHIVQRLKHLTLRLPQFDLPPCELVYVALERIKFEKYTMCLNVQDESIPLHKQPPICLDEENALIFGEKIFYLYKYHTKKTIPAWRISLADLAKGHYNSELFVKNFLISERVAIGIALENFLGNRQGYRSDLEKVKSQAGPHKKRNIMIKGPKKTRLMNKYAQVSLEKRTPLRQLIANRLGFGSHFTYQNAKKIKLYASAELIGQVDQRNISISKAAKLCPVLSIKKTIGKKLPYNECK